MQIHIIYFLETLLIGKKYLYEIKFCSRHLIKNFNNPSKMKSLCKNIVFLWKKLAIIYTIGFTLFFYRSLSIVKI